MASLILFGIIALIVIVFLLSFNIKTISRPEKVKPEIDKPKELPVNRVTIPQSEGLENQKPRENAKRVDNKLPRISDDQYRQALRKFDSSPENKSAIISQNRFNDSAYRNAARSIYKKQNKV